MCSWFSASLLDWAARCDVAGRPAAAAEAFALAAALGRPVTSRLERARLARRLLAFADDAERRGHPALGLTAREAAAEVSGEAVGGNVPAAGTTPVALGTLRPHAV